MKSNHLRNRRRLKKYCFREISSVAADLMSSENRAELQYVNVTIGNRNIYTNQQFTNQIYFLHFFTSMCYLLPHSKVIYLLRILHLRTIITHKIRTKARTWFVIPSAKYERVYKYTLQIYN